MSADANIKTIAEVYQAFGRGDVAAILDAVTDDVDWAAEAASPAAPWYGVRHGRDACGLGLAVLVLAGCHRAVPGLALAR